MSIEESEVKAHNIHRLQVLQSEVIATQSQAQDSLQVNMKVTQALLDKVSATAANLQSIMDDSIIRFRGSSSVYGSFGKYSIWTFCAMASTIFGVLNPRSGVVLLLLGASECKFRLFDPAKTILMFLVHFLAVTLS